MRKATKQMSKNLCACYWHTHNVFLLQHGWPNPRANWGVQRSVRVSECLFSDGVTSRVSNRRRTFDNEHASVTSALQSNHSVQSFVLLWHKIVPFIDVRPETAMTSLILSSWEKMLGIMSFVTWLRDLVPGLIKIFERTSSRYRPILYLKDRCSHWNGSGSWWAWFRSTVVAHGEACIAW